MGSTRERPKAPWALLVLCALAGGCAAQTDDTEIAADELTTLRPVDTAVAFDRSATRPRSRPIPGVEVGCSGRRVVGHRQRPTAHTCPPPVDPTLWSGGLLFPIDGVADPDRRQHVFGTDGGVFCVYDYVGRGQPTSVSGLPIDAYSTRPSHRDRAPEQWLSADCESIVPLAESTPEQRAERRVAHREAWREQLDWMPRLPVFPATGSLPTAGPFLIEVSLIDTSPDSGPWLRFPTEGVDPHGRGMGMLITDVLCPAGIYDATSGCPHLIRSYQAIPEARALGARTLSSAGLMTRVAQRIVEATQQSPGRRGIINLSLGGLPRYALIDPGGDDVLAWREATVALQAALNYASCNDMIVIAAGGNDEAASGVPRDFWEEGALYPAALATTEAWTCGQPVPGVTAPGRGVPLVYAASGVDARDRAVPTTRDGSRARLAGPAFATGVENPADYVVSDPEELPLYTGSSVAAADVSAVAALVWAYAPSLSPAEVMGIVESSAVPLTEWSELCGGDFGCGETRRVSACRALRSTLARVCHESGRADVCAAHRDLVCTTIPAGEGRPPEMPEGFFESLRPVRETLSLSAHATPALCVDPGQALATWVDESATIAGDASYCPARAYPNGIAGTTLGPQPPEGPCRVCALELDDDRLVLYAELEPWAATFADAYLITDHAQIALGSKLFSAGEGELVVMDIELSQLGGDLQSDAAHLVLKVPDSEKVAEAWVPIYR